MADVREPAAAGNAAHVHDKLHADPEQQPGELVAGSSAVPDRKQAPARRILTRRSASRILLAGTSDTANTPLVTSPRQHWLVECGPVSHQSGGSLTAAQIIITIQLIKTNYGALS
jgi:hypothetical protein